MDMSIFVNSRFDDEDARRDFLLANSVSHDQIAINLLQKGMGILSYPLIDVTNDKDWLNMHNDVHQQEFLLLGLGNQYNGIYDLSDADLSNQDSYYDWMWQHVQIHQFINNMLGLV